MIRTIVYNKVSKRPASSREIGVLIAHNMLSIISHDDGTILMHLDPDQEVYKLRTRIEEYKKEA